MKTYRCYNTKLTEIPGWKTIDKRGQIEIHDPDNQMIFAIQFGRKPKISVYTGDFNNLGTKIFEKSFQSSRSPYCSDCKAPKSGCGCSGGN